MLKNFKLNLQNGSLQSVHIVVNCTNKRSAYFVNLPNNAQILKRHFAILDLKCPGDPTLFEFLCAIIAYINFTKFYKTKL